MKRRIVCGVCGLAVTAVLGGCGTGPAADGFFPQTRQASIYRSVRVDGGWQTPGVAPFSGEHSDIDPFITPDGEWLYFSSIRPPEGGAPDVVDLWRVPREGEGWGAPERVSASTPRDDLYPSLDLEGRLHFGNPVEAGEGSGHWRVVVAQPTGDRYDGRYEEPVPIPGGVNTETHRAFNPAVSPDGRRLLFTRLNPTDAQATGFGELYIAHLEGEGDVALWSDPITLGPPVNTSEDEFHPALSPDGRWLYFVRRDPFAADPKGDLYRIEFDAVEALTHR